MNHTENQKKKGKSKREIAILWIFAAVLLLAVIAGGDLMGVVGMFIFIPLVSVLYAYFRSIVYRRIKKREINVDDKQVPDDVVPLGSAGRRLFAMKSKVEKTDSKKQNKEM